MLDPKLYRLIRLRRAISVLCACYALAILPPGDSPAAPARPTPAVLTASTPPPLAPPTVYWIERVPWSFARGLAWHLRYRPVILLPPQTPPTAHRNQP